MTRIELQKDIEQKLPFLSEQKLEALHTVLGVLLNTNKTPKKPNRKRGLVGSMPDLVNYIADDFNEPLDDFNEYMPE